ncbi:SpoIID/LytB domain-containing protein [Candidatus Poriferisocius sp.]|uniref:SpoIID/LytB domain-containing protein n=1 Tax=Candidatus Poriferisocius sp. TaxID=3101276 RepID=UPI003B01517A
MHWLRLVVLNRLRSYLLITAVGALTISVVATVAARAQNDPEPVLIVDPAAVVTFTGSGWGHGVGLSQWGAHSRALAGQTSTDILAFYFEGANLAENYGRPLPPPTPEPTPEPPPESVVTIPVPTSLESPVAVHLATTTTTTLTPTGLNRITIDNNNITHNSQPETRAPANTPITFTRHNNNWHITINGTNICNTGCPGHTAQLLFASNTSVAISNTGRSHAHGRINLIPNPNNPTQFHITLDHLTANTYLNDQTQPPTPGNDPPAAPTSLESPVAVHLATTTTTTLTPTGLNRITIDNNNITHNSQPETRAPANTPITFTRHNNNWHITINGTNICNTGCPGHTAQLLFASNTSVAISNTGRSHAHGRINLIPNPNNPTQFHITLDHLTANTYLNDQTQPTNPPTRTPPKPEFPEDSIRVHLATTTATTLTPTGLNRITIDNNNITHNGQPETRAPANTPITFTHHNGHWHVAINGTDICNTGCPGRTAQLLFGLDTSVAVSTTGHSYRHGRINLVPDTSNKFHVVLDLLSMEEYLRGIAEIPGNWPTAAIESQVIAARSYAIAALERRRAADTWPHPFDLYSSTWDQVYIGDTTEMNPRMVPWVQAVENTAGRTLLYGGAKVQAFYSSSNGGHTERSNYVFHSDLAYLKAKPDPFDQQHSPHASWTRTYPVSTFNRWLNDHDDTRVGRLIGMELTGGLGESGRMDRAQILITGTDRTITISGNRLRARINTATSDDGLGRAGQLLSTRFTFSVPPATAPQDSPPVPADPTGDPADPGQPPSDNQRFYSGVITGPDFCLNRSLGGPITYPFDSNGDGIADNCVLPRTRRASVAHQNALEQLALVFPEKLRAHMAEECLAGPATLGEPQNEATDECSLYLNRQTTAGISSEPEPGPDPTPGTPTEPTPTTTPTPGTPTEPTPTPGTPTGEDRAVNTPDPLPDSSLFYSGVITSPDFCLNRSLGGPITYPFDSNGDGIADNCVLPRTRRASVARQNALEQLAREYPIHFGAHLVRQCQLGKQTFGEPQKEAADECAPYIDPNQRK